MSTNLDARTVPSGSDLLPSAAAGMFVVCSPGGDVDPGGPRGQGLWFRDTRFLDQLVLTVDGRPPRVLETAQPGPDRTRWRLRAGHDGAGLEVVRERIIDGSVRERLVVSNPGPE